MTKWPLVCIRVRILPHSLRATPFLAATMTSTMDPSSSKRLEKRQENALSLLDVTIGALNLAKDACGIPPAQAAFGSVSILLTMIRVRFPLLSDDLSQQKFTCNQDSMANRTDYVELGLACAEVCKALDRGMNGRRMDELSQSVFEAIGQLTT